MCQNSNGNCCQDYSLQTANTGIATINTANGNLDGTGAVTTIFTAGQLGAIVKSVTIKATGPVTRGIVRIYINDGNATALYKEVQIPVSPTLDNTPTPTPVLAMYETMLMGDIKLQTGHTLLASTQVGDTFNIIVEGLDWDYPNPLPANCCNFKQISAITGVGVVNTANENTDGTGAITTILVAPQALNSNGTRIKKVTIKAMGSTRIYGMIRIYVGVNANTFRLLREVQIPETEQSAYEPSYKNVIDLDFQLQAGYLIGASTQTADAFAITVEGEEWSYPI